MGNPEYTQLNKDTRLSAIDADCTGEIMPVLKPLVYHARTTIPDSPLWSQEAYDLAYAIDRIVSDRRGADRMSIHYPSQTVVTARKYAPSERMPNTVYLTIQYNFRSDRGMITNLSPIGGQITAVTPDGNHQGETVTSALFLMIAKDQFKNPRGCHDKITKLMRTDDLPSRTQALTAVRLPVNGLFCIPDVEVPGVERTDSIYIPSGFHGQDLIAAYYKVGLDYYRQIFWPLPVVGKRQYWYLYLTPERYLEQVDLSW